MRRRRVLVAAGGTGGHILPGICVGRALANSGAVEVQYFAGRRPIENEIYRGEGIEPTLLRTGYSRGSKFMQSIEMAFDFAAMTARMIVNRPAAVVAMGGAACFPVLSAARLLRIPIFLHESNRIPGKVIRLFAKIARRVFLGLGGLEGKNVSVTGTPTKGAVEINGERDVVLCVGGSQGATALNDMFIAAANSAELCGCPLKFVLIAGPGKAPVAPGRVEVRAYEPNLPALLSRCVLAVSRSGAGALADFANFRIPAILVPYPHAMDDHQTANAKVYADAEAALLLDEKRLTGPILTVAMERLLMDETQLLAMSSAVAGFDSSGSARAIADEILASIASPSRASSLARSIAR